MKKVLFLSVFFIVSMVTQSAIGMGIEPPTEEEIAELERNVTQAEYQQELLSLSAMDRMQFMSAPEGSRAARVYARYSEKEETLPVANWAELIYREHVRAIEDERP